MEHELLDNDVVEHSEPMTSNYLKCTVTIHHGRDNTYLEMDDRNGSTLVFSGESAEECEMKALKYQLKLPGEIKSKYFIDPGSFRVIRMYTIGDLIISHYEEVPDNLVEIDPKMPRPDEVYAEFLRRDYELELNYERKRKAWKEEFLEAVREYYGTKKPVFLKREIK